MEATRVARRLGPCLALVLVLNAAHASADADVTTWQPTTGLDSLPTDQAGTAGALDPAFGGYGEGGRLLTPVFGTQAFRDAVQLPDGSVIAVGSTGADFLVAKYAPGGELDPSFGELLGWEPINLSAGADFANTVAIAPDGKIILAGQTDTGTAANFGLVRLNPDGSLDIGFGNGGIQTIDFNGRRDQAQAILVEAGGDILVAGAVEEAGGFCLPDCAYNLGVARLKGADGAPDGNFGSGGKVQTDLGGSEYGLSLATGNCGFYAAGFRAADIGVPAQYVIARYHSASGAPIASFGGAGVVTGTTLSRIVDMTCRPDASLLAYGDGVAGSGVGLLNLTDAGAPVSGYGSGGSALLSVSGASVVAAGALRVLPDYSTVIGYTLDQQLSLARFTRQGTLIPGTLAATDMADVGATTVQALDVALTPDVRVRAIAGLETGDGPRLALAQHFLDGTPDDGGRQALDNISNIDQAAAVAFQPDGKLLVAGSTQAGWPSYGPKAGLLARYTAQGELDATFGLGGRLALEFFDKQGAKGIVVQPDGKIVVMGWEFDLVRLEAGGLDDSSFGTLGWANANWTGATSQAVARQSDGKLVLAGSRIPTGGSATFAVARFTTGGVLDSGFGAGGTVATGVGPLSAGGDLAIQPDGKIVVAGLTTPDGNDFLAFDFALVRYLPNGNVDNTFGTNGRVTTDFGSGEIASAVLVLRDGTIMAAGASGSQGMALARYLPSGALDPSFGAGGKVLLQFTGQEMIADLALDGPHLVAAVCDQVAGSGLVARLTGDGELDDGFNGNGRAPFDFPGDDCPMAVAVGPGRIAAAGTSHAGLGDQDYFNDDFAVAMYLSGRFDLFLPLLTRGQ